MRVKSDKQIQSHDNTTRNISILISLALLSLFYVSQHLNIVRLGEDIKTQEASLNTLRDQKDMLLSKVAELESPSSITQKLGSMHLNFQYPEKVRVLKL